MVGNPGTGECRISPPVAGAGFPRCLNTDWCGYYNGENEDGYPIQDHPMVPYWIKYVADAQAKSQEGIHRALEDLSRK